MACGALFTLCTLALADNRLTKCDKGLITDRLSCALACREDIRCTVFSYNRKSGVCCLKLLTLLNDTTTVSELGSNIFKMNPETCGISGFVKFGEHLCIKHISETYAWIESLTVCKEAGGRLLVLDTDEKLEAALQYMRNEGISKAPVNVGFGLVGGRYMWINGSPVANVSVNVDKPCGKLRFDQLLSGDCDFQRKVICERSEL